MTGANPPSDGSAPKRRTLRGSAPVP